MRKQFTENQGRVPTIFITSKVSNIIYSFNKIPEKNRLIKYYINELKGNTPESPVIFFYSKSSLDIILS